MAEGGGGALHPEIFPMATPPRAPFDGRQTPAAPPADLWIVDVTQGVGQEAFPPWEAKGIVDFYEALHRLGGPRGALRQFECAIGRPQEREALGTILGLEYSFPEPVAWVPAPPEGFRQAARLGIREVTFPVPGSAYATRPGWPTDGRERAAQAVTLAREALGEGLVPKIHLEDVARADWAGWLLPLAHDLMRAAERQDAPVKLRLVDTCGAGLAHPEAGMPRGVPRLVEQLRGRLSYPAEWIEWLGAQDLGMALPNGVAAWLAGCSGCAGTVAGLGERAGWAATELLLAHYIGLRGEANGVSLKALQGVVEAMRACGVTVPVRAPLSGAQVLQSAHPDAALRPETSFPFDPERVLGRAAQEGIRAGCGMDELARVAARMLGWSVVDPQHPGIVRLKDWVDAACATGRSGAITPQELRAQLPVLFPDSPPRDA